MCSDSKMLHELMLKENFKICRFLKGMYIGWKTTNTCSDDTDKRSEVMGSYVEHAPAFELSWLLVGCESNNAFLSEGGLS